MNIQEKISKLVKNASIGLYEREEAIKLCFAALLAQESVFMLGKPGVGKSFVARRMKDAIKGGNNFEYLMNRFSTPEEIFGPISLKKLDEDKYERVVEGYLPSADVAFLDEIWKASPAIQNTLLTIINEKLFRNGSQDIEVPLKLLVSASNELPAVGEGLEALYDRFIIRYYVENVQDIDSFNSLITSKGIDEYKLKPELALSMEELEQAGKSIKQIKVPSDILNFIDKLRKMLVVKLGDQAPYVSDRRWKKIINILQATAYAANRDKVSNSDLLIIPYTIWETESQQKQINEVFDEVWIDFVGRETGQSINEIVETINRIKKEFSVAYFYEKKHNSLILGDEQGVQRQFYKFSLANNNDHHYWFPIIDGKLIEGTTTYPDYFVFYYSSKSSETPPTNRERKRNSELNLDSKTFVGYKMMAEFEEVERIDVPKLQELKKQISLENIKLVSIGEKLEDSFASIEKESNVLIDNYGVKVKIAKAYIKDQLTSKTHDLSELQAEIVGALRGKDDFSPEVELQATKPSSDNKSNASIWDSRS